MKTINKLALAGVLALSMSFNASALLLKPADADWQGSSPKNPSPDQIETITGTSAQLTLAYKKDVGGSESGGFTGSYNTTFANTTTDPEDATITYTGGSAITGTPIYLLVKDGDNDPIWYLFDITGWNGTETIYLEDFWPAQGAISHVSIVTPGGGGTTVPDGGTTLALLGLALTGIGFARRKFNV